MEKISSSVIILFIITVIITVWLFFRSAKYPPMLIAVITIWIILQSALGLNGFYTEWNAVPPRFILLIAPAVVCIIILLLTKQGRQFADNLNIKTLTLLHVIRIPVEITLYYLSVAKLIPRSMTFEGSNFDIISGITAPLIYYFVFVAKKISSKVFLMWNLLCLGLLLNVVITAILSAKTPFQQFAFDQPAICIAYFPFVLLPGVIVPIVLFSHLVIIRKLLLDFRKKQSQSGFAYSSR